MFRKFFYAAAGLFLLVLAFHLGNTRATAQGAGSFISISAAQPGYGTSTVAWALTSDGRVYYAGSPGSPFELVGTIGGSTTTIPQSWGQVKERYR
jgi:hypothetical protein